MFESFEFFLWGYVAVGIVVAFTALVIKVTYAFRHAPSAPEAIGEALMGSIPEAILFGVGWPIVLIVLASLFYRYKHKQPIPCYGSRVH